METIREIDFAPIGENEHRVPYIRDKENVDYVFDGSDGSITFDGYFYVEDHAPPYAEDEGLKRWETDRHSEWLPKKMFMHVQLREKEPWKTEVSEDRMSTSVFYNTIEDNAYIIEVYRREKYECTDQISEIEDDDGTPMNVCFFPTMRQKIWFRVLEVVR
jgi:hypothetical protein